MDTEVAKHVGLHVEMAAIHRPGDFGIDLPAGASAAELQSSDYHPVEMPDDDIHWAVVYRSGDVGIDLPAGACARDLAPTDYRPVEMEETA